VSHVFTSATARSAPDSFGFPRITTRWGRN
jgi:hypothetical protein